MGESMNIGVIGAGRIGMVHAESLAHRGPGARLAAIADVDPDTARTAAERFGIPRAVSDHRAMLEDPAIAAVSICSSTDTHARLIIEAAESGKHIFCEKPIAHDLGEIDRALAAVDAAGVKLQIGFNRRFDANFQRVRQAIASGEIGEPSLLHIISRDPAPPPISYIRVSGGMFLDMIIHDFDMARFLIGAEVAEVYAVAGVRVDPAIGEAGDVDTAIITLKFENGVLGVIDNSRRAAYGYDQRVEVLGSLGSASVGNNYPNAASISDAQSVRRDLPLNFFMDRYAESYTAELRAFVDAVRNDTPVPVSGRDGRIPVVMGLAATLSHREGRPVALSEIT